MYSRDVALRFSVVFAVAGFIALVTSLYEIDRRAKSSSETVTANLTEIELRVQDVSNQIRILNEQYTRQLIASERQVRALNTEIQALQSRLNELEDDLRVRAPVPRKNLDENRSELVAPLPFSPNLD
jgi:predicted  nucleic acid-binding Zn-ribbon protein